MLQIKDILKAVDQEAYKVLVGLRKWKMSGLESKRSTCCKMSLGTGRGLPAWGFSALLRSLSLKKYEK